MSISKLGLYGLCEKAETRTKSRWATPLIVLITTVSLLSALDLLIALIREDSLAAYTRSILGNLAISVLGCIFCSDLIVEEDRDTVTCFIAYMVFLWICLTVLKIVFLS